MTDTQRAILFMLIVGLLDLVLLLMMLKALRDQNLMIHSLSNRIRDLQNGRGERR